MDEVTTSICMCFNDTNHVKQINAKCCEDERCKMEFNVKEKSQVLEVSEEI